jgi:hypothetical protein
MTAGDKPDTDDLAQLATLRRRCAVRLTRITTTLSDRPGAEPPWRIMSMRQQLRDLGYHRSLDEAGLQELQSLAVFLQHWLDLLPMVDGVLWPDPVHDDDEP